jgi:DNA gyrase subunit A
MAGRGRRRDAGGDELLPFAREVIDVPVSAELGESFLAYSLSVITSRAIPDVRDGLKPVQRRILYSMRQMRLFPDRPHRKCAHVVGDVMAKFHPHGDGAIYDTLVRLGQDFARPVPLIDPQGNFGSLDDPPAAYRYTECRLTAAAVDLLGEIDEETVEFRPTYDGEDDEPVYLPGLLPNLLVNGTSGIAVGMATNMAPHNLGEVYEAIKLVMAKRRPRPTLDELLAVLPGPDFPSGGLVVDDGLRDAYETGRGAIRVRARAEVVDVTRTRQGISVTELPYLVGPERVVAKIKEQLSLGRLAGVADVKNLSDRTSGLRLVIEAKPGVNPAVLLEQLYRFTPMEETFGINNVVLVDGVPTTLGLYDLCRHYVEHRLDIVVKRSEHRLREAQKRLHLVDGLLIAIDHIDAVVAIIRSSADSPTARQRLMDELSLSETQAEYVLELRLRRLTALAYDELQAERTELVGTIAELEQILGSEQRQRSIVIRELGELVSRYGRPRRTRIVSATEVAAAAPLAVEAGVAAMAEEEADQPCVVSLTASGLLGREPQGTSRSYAPSRHDVLDSVAVTTMRSTVWAVTAGGKVQPFEAGSVPEVGGRSRGREAGEVAGADRGDAVVALATAEGGPLLLVTALGVVKRVDRPALVALRPGRPVIGLADRDRVVAVFEAGEGDDVVLVASDAQCLRLPASSVAVQGPPARGVAGMALRGTARLVGAGVARDGTVIVTVTDAGTAKATSVDEVPVKGRGTTGVRLTRFKHESRLDYAWIGVPDRTVTVVGQGDAPTRPDPTPVPLSLRPTRRDGFSNQTERRILRVGSLRW